MAPSNTSSSFQSANNSSVNRQRGFVKAVPSGDSLVIVLVGKNKAEFEKNVILFGINAPRMNKDEEFELAWQSRDYLRKLCLGKEVVFTVEYTNPENQREFASVFLNNQNLSRAVLAQGWARVRKHQGLSDLKELTKLEASAKQNDCGIWKEAKGKTFRKPPPSALRGATNFNAKALLDKIKDQTIHAFVEKVTIHAFVEKVRNGTTLWVYLLPDFYLVQVFVQGVRAPTLGGRTPQQEDDNSNQASSNKDTAEDSLGRLCKRFVECRILNRYVEVVLGDCDSKGNFVGSVFYHEGEEKSDLAVDLLQDGLAKYLEDSARILGKEARKYYKEVELDAKKNQIGMWKNYVLHPSKLQPINDEKFYGKVVEVVSGDCLDLEVESTKRRRVYLSGIRAPNMGHPRTNEAKDYLRRMVIGKTVYVIMEYFREIVQKNNKETRKMEFASVFLPEDTNNKDVVFAKDSVNVAEVIVEEGLAWIVRTKDLEVEPMYYDYLLEAESVARNNQTGLHSLEVPSPKNIVDLSSAHAWEARSFLNHLHQRKSRPMAIVDSVFCGDTFKLRIPTQQCAITFSFSGVQCPGRNEAYGEEALDFMRRSILQHDVQVQVDFMDNSGTFFGSLWESETNLAVTLLQEGLAKLIDSFNVERTSQGKILVQAQKRAREQKLKVWENYREGKEILKVLVTENVGGGEFYVNFANERNNLQKICQQLNAFGNNPPHLAGFQPKRGDSVLAQYGLDKSWHRAVIVDAGGSNRNEHKVFYIDYGNQGMVPLSNIRPHDKSVSSGPGLAYRCSLAYIQVPHVNKNFGNEAKEFLDKSFGKEAEDVYTKDLNATIEERVFSHKQEVLLVTLTSTDGKKETNINAALLGEGLAQLRTSNIHKKDRAAAIEKLRKYQAKAEEEKLNIWQA